MVDGYQSEQFHSVATQSCKKKLPTFAWEKEAAAESRPLRRGAYGPGRGGILPNEWSEVALLSIVG
jgi:hypothetical protein